jgi:hypothetical protein
MILAGLMQFDKGHMVEICFSQHRFVKQRLLLEYCLNEDDLKFDCTSDLIALFAKSYRVWEQLSLAIANLLESGVYSIIRVVQNNRDKKYKLSLVLSEDFNIGDTVIIDIDYLNLQYMLHNGVGWVESYTDLAESLIKLRRSNSCQKWVITPETQSIKVTSFDASVVLPYITFEPLSDNSLGIYLTLADIPDLFNFVPQLNSSFSKLEFLNKFYLHAIVVSHFHNRAIINVNLASPVIFDGYSSATTEIRFSTVCSDVLNNRTNSISQIRGWLNERRMQRIYRSISPRNLRINIDPDMQRREYQFSYSPRIEGIGDLSCKYNAKSSLMRCAINPSGPCDLCQFKEND